jgi:hypothetical protein
MDLIPLANFHPNPEPRAATQTLRSLSPSQLSGKPFSLLSTSTLLEPFDTGIFSDEPASQIFYFDDSASQLLSRRTCVVKFIQTNLRHKKKKIYPDEPASYCLHIYSPIFFYCPINLHHNNYIYPLAFRCLINLCLLSTI